MHEIEVQLEDDDDNKPIDPQQLLRMMRTAVLREHLSLLPLLCSFQACDDQETDQLASLLKDALQRDSISAAQKLLDRHPAARQMHGDEVEQVLQQAVLITGPTGYGSEGQQRAREVAAVAEQIAGLPGVAQLSSERLSVVLRAAVQRQAVLARSAERQLNRRSGWGANTAEQSLWTPLDGVVDVLCGVTQADNSSAAGSDDDTDACKDGSAAAARPQLPAAAVQELLVSALQLQNWRAVQSLCRCCGAQQLTQADAVLLLQRHVRAVAVGSQMQGALAAAAAAAAKALCSLPAVRELDSGALAAVLQHVVLGGSNCSSLVEGLCQLPAARQLSRGVVDGLVAAAGASGARGVLKALTALQGCCY
jgi:hypothetical protein